MGRSLGTCGNHLRRGRLRATITHVFTINHVAEMLGKDRELLEAIVSNSDNLTYGSIIVSARRAHFCSRRRCLA
ncbi:hypothetical protein C7U62_22520 [Mesorhizobium loti]|nr:hypothetical protein [Sinorhizobium meliloti]PST20696.1 hypothetical protein C7U62_22520 [Mesorhizobium loti]RVO69030.1 hypothetical protein CN091_32415 [Sinorhizobium meliloti]